MAALKDLLGAQTLAALGLTTVFVLGYSAQIGADIGVYLSSVGDYVSYVLSLLPAAIVFCLYIAIVMIAGLGFLAVVFAPALLVYQLLKRWPKFGIAAAAIFGVGALGASALLQGDYNLGFWSYRGPFAGFENDFSFAVLRPLVLPLGYDVQSLADLEYRWPHPLDTEIAQTLVWMVVGVAFFAGIAGSNTKKETGSPEGNDNLQSETASSGKSAGAWLPFFSLLGLIFCVALYSAGMMKARLDIERRFPVTMHFTADSGLGAVTARPMFSTERGMIVATDDAITFYRWDQIRMVERAR